MTRRERIWALLVCAGMAAGSGVAVAAGDGTFSSTRPDASFNPVVLSTTVADPQHVGTKVAISVVVTASAGVLDLRSAAVGVTGRQSQLKVEVKLAPRCGTEYSSTTGLTLIDRLLVPQPSAGTAYTGTVTSDSVTPRSTGTDVACVWLVDGEAPLPRIFASDQSQTVVIAKALPKQKGGSSGGSA